MATESRIVWEDQKPLPEGWRRCHNTVNDLGESWQLQTSAPGSTSPFDARYCYRWVELRRRTEYRQVTEWVRV